MRSKSSHGRQTDIIFWLSLSNLKITQRLRQYKYKNI